MVDTGGLQFRKEWYGDRIAVKYNEASRRALQETIDMCVRRAKPLTPVDTGRLQASIRSERVRKDGDKLRGRWGSMPDAMGPVHYARFVEEGTVYMAAHWMLNRAAVQEYPKLIERIRKYT